MAKNISLWVTMATKNDFIFLFFILIALDFTVNMVCCTTYYIAYISPVAMYKCIKTTNLHFITVVMATKIRFLIIFLLIMLELA